MKTSQAVLSLILMLGATAVNAGHNLPPIPDTHGGWDLPNGGYFHNAGCVAMCPRGDCSWYGMLGNPYGEGVCYCTQQGYPVCEARLTGAADRWSYKLWADRDHAAVELQQMGQTIVSTLGDASPILTFAESLANLGDQVLFGDGADYAQAIQEVEAAAEYLTAEERDQAHQIAQSILGPGSPSP